MTSKPRRFDLHPDQFIAAIAGEMSPEELGVYFMTCLLIYSNAGPIEDDPSRIAASLENAIRGQCGAILDRLESMSKVQRNGAELMANGCRTEIEAALNRMRTYRENGMNGGRPSKKNKDIEKPSGFSADNPPAPSIPIPIPIPIKDNPPTPRKRVGVLVNGELAAFEKFYQAYPRHEDRGHAERAFLAAIKIVDLDTLVMEAKKYAQQVSGQDQKFTKLPATWLNGKCWLDEPTAPPKRLAINMM